MLKVKNLKTSYGHIHALKGINLDVEQGEIVTLIGSNGAGKTTTLMSIMGMLKSEPGSIVEFEGEDITHCSPSVLVKKDSVWYRRAAKYFRSFPYMTISAWAAFTRKQKAEIKDTYEKVYELFPRLKEREKQMAGTLSGGEQQMLAIGRALMAQPRLLMLDEPSLGLAPNIVQQIFALIKQINEQGTTVLLVEQNAYQALRIADRGYIIETGYGRLSGDAKELRESDEVRRAYLGNVGD